MPWKVLFMGLTNLPTTSTMHHLHCAFSKRSKQDVYTNRNPKIRSYPTSISYQTPSMVVPEPTSPSPNLVFTSDADADQVNISRPRPQCWGHNCNGREFSTFSNLLRHERERSGVVAKAECPMCGAVFTRTAARNIHVAQRKCKGPARETSAK